MTAKWQAANRDKYLAGLKRWRAANPAKYVAGIKAWQADHPEMVKAQIERAHIARREREASDPQLRERRQAVGRKWYAANRESVLARTAAYRRKHPELYRVAKNRYRTRAAENGGALSEVEWLAICEGQDGKCARCSQKRKLTLDHVVPVSRGGPTTRENVQALCKPCNSSKSVKTVDYRIVSL